MLVLEFFKALSPLTQTKSCMTDERITPIRPNLKSPIIMAPPAKEHRIKSIGTPELFHLGTVFICA